MFSLNTILEVVLVLACISVLIDICCRPLRENADTVPRGHLLEAHALELVEHALVGKEDLEELLCALLETNYVGVAFKDHVDDGLISELLVEGVKPDVVGHDSQRIEFLYDWKSLQLSTPHLIKLCFEFLIGDFE